MKRVKMISCMMKVGPSPRPLRICAVLNSRSVHLDESMFVSAGEFKLGAAC